jgi:hypothetical protein
MACRLVPERPETDRGHARAVIVKPLIKKLRRTQKRALERLKVSNRQILEHVEEEAVDHVYNLLRAAQQKSKADASVQKKKLKLQAMKEKLTNEKKAAKAAAKQVRIDASLGWHPTPLSSR